MKTTIAALLLLALPAVARTQEIRLAVPGDRDHLRKMTEELIQLSRAKDPDTKIDLFLRLSEERARELARMQEMGRSTHHDALGKSYDTLLKKGAAGAIEGGAARGRDMTGACGRYTQATFQHTAVLERVLAKAPPAARKGLLTALAASQHGQEQAMLAHQRGKGKAGRGGPPDCGSDRDRFKQGLKKKGRSDGDCERETADHFKKVHSDGGDCHCSCDRSKGHGKGNNGVGNGQDPQPPGNPPVNDGPGAGPGGPGNKGGPPGKGQGPPPDKGHPGADEGPGKGKGPGGEDGPGKGKSPGVPPPGKGPGGDDGPGKGKGPGGPPPGKGKGGS